MRPADTILLLFYFVLMVGIGVYFARYMKNVDVYFVGGKKLPWWLGGVSFLMSYVSALSIVMYTAMGYTYGIVSMTLYAVSVPACLLTSELFARRWHRAGISTPVEFLERRFSAGLRQVFAWSGIPLKVVDEGLKIIAVAVFVSTGLGVSLNAAIVLTGVIIVVYTTLGGLWAVFITDFIQFVLVTVAVVLLLPLSLQKTGGVSAFVSQAPEGFFDPLHAPYGAFYLVGFVLLVSLSLAGNWSLIQRFYASRSETDARRVGWLATALFLVLPPIWIFAGMAARVWLPGDWAKSHDPQYVYAEICRLLLPPGLLGLVVAALFAATMSVLSAGYNVIASVLTVDVYQRLIRPDASQRRLVAVGKILTVIVGACAMIVAWIVIYLKWTLFDTMVAAFGFFLPPTVLPVLAGLLWPRVTSRGALAGFITGIVSGAAFLVAKPFLPAAYGPSLQTVSLWVSSLVVVAAMAAFSSRDEKERGRVAEFYDSLKRPAPASPVADVPEPFLISGVVLLLLGIMLAGIGWVTGTPSALASAIGLLLAFLGGLLLVRHRRTLLKAE